MREVAVAVALALACLASAGGAAANGAFPASGQVLVDPTDARRIAVKTTYGLVISVDGGATWTWTCEPAMFIPGGDFHPQLAFTPDGVLYGGLPDGMLRGRLGACAWERAPSLEGATVVDVSQSGSRGIAVVIPPGGGAAGVWLSEDDAATWEPMGADLPEDFTPFTLDAAPSDPSILYVSGLVAKEPPIGAVARSDDGGATWSVSNVARADATHVPYIAAVDAEDPAVVWLRLDGAPGELQRSINGGVSFTRVLASAGFLNAFSLSPDGTRVLAGGPSDGLLVADTAAPDVWEPFADIGARCAAWREDALDLCGNESTDGFAAARSVDEGATFAPLYQQRCLSGPEACAPSTPVGACAEAWPALQETLSADGCPDEVGSGGGGASPAGGTAAATTGSGDVATTGVGTSATVAAVGAGGGPPADGAEPASDAGCGCGVAGESTRPAPPAIAALVVALRAVRRRARGARTRGAPPARACARG